MAPYVSLMSQEKYLHSREVSRPRVLQRSKGHETQRHFLTGNPSQSVGQNSRWAQQSKPIWSRLGYSAKRMSQQPYWKRPSETMRLQNHGWEHGDPSHNSSRRSRSTRGSSHGRERGDRSHNSSQHSEGTRYSDPRRRALKVSVVGHSFVRRLQDALRDSNEELCPGADASFHGRSGFLAEDILCSYRPCGEDYIILDIGTNDLVNGISGEELAAQVFSFCQYFQEDNSNLKKIYVLDIVDRVKTRAVSRREFTRQKDKYNEKIRQISRSYSFIEAVDQDLHSMDITKWSRDGIHADTALGKNTYLLTIKSLISQLM